MDEIDILQAEILKALAHPRRLQILYRLAAAPTGVARLAIELGMSQPNTSQHLAVMRAAGVVEAERDGREVHYRLADPDVTVACSLMRSVLARRLTRLGEMAASAAAASVPTAAAASVPTAAATTVSPLSIRSASR